MDASYKKYVFTTPRHFRALYFVESDISQEVLTEIFHHNIQVWGGRYNPIVPVKDNKIDDSYLELIKPLDPDMIFYSHKVDVEEIKKQIQLYPGSYEILDERGYPTAGGIDYHYLLNESNRDFMDYHEKLPILNIHGSYQIDFIAKNFYKTNFALLDLHANQERLIRGFDIIPITKKNHKGINKIITEKRPYFKSILSQLKVNTCVFRPKDLITSDRFEMIISDMSSSNDDLFYFWNRQQYIRPNGHLNQILISKQDFKLLIKDPFFEGVLHLFKIDNTIHISSRTISKDELEQLKDDIQQKFKYIRFDAIFHTTFPYEIYDYRYHNDLENEKTKQIFTNGVDLLKLPTPRLTDRIQPKGGYAVDIEVDVDLPGESPANRIKYPYRYHLYNGRINKFHNQSYFVNCNTSVIDFKVQNNFEIFQNRLQHIKGDGNNPKDTSIQYVRYSNAGQKLYALLDLFDNNWFSLTSLIGDKFWIDVFRYKSELNKKQSNIPKGKGIFSYKDLVRERQLLYKKHEKAIETKLKNETSELDVEKMIDWYVNDDFKSYIDYNLQDLLDLGAVFMGIKVKCNTCGSNKWYGLKELQDQLPCKGCNRTVIPRIESTYYYRINEIIINNLLSDVTSNAKDFDGNYVVLKTLDYLKSGSRQGFSYCCPLDYAVKGKWVGDIDILALQDGKFIIGEAKNDAKEFNNTEIESLIWLANNIEPDAVILAHNMGKLTEKKLQTLRAGISSDRCEIITYQVSRPVYMSGGLWGLQ